MASCLTVSGSRVALFSDCLAEVVSSQAEERRGLGWSVMPVQKVKRFRNERERSLDCGLTLNSTRHSYPRSRPTDYEYSIFSRSLSERVNLEETDRSQSKSRVR